MIFRGVYRNVALHLSEIRSLAWNSTMKFRSELLAFKFHGESRSEVLIQDHGAEFGYPNTPRASYLLLPGTADLSGN